MVEIRYKRMIIYIFLIILVLLQFRMAAKQGYVLLPMELTIAFLFFIWERKKILLFRKQDPLNIWIFFLIYSLVVSVLIDLTDYSAYKGMIYRCVGMTIMVYFISLYTTHKDILIEARNVGGVFAILGTIECLTKQSIFLQFITVESRQLMSAQLGTSAARVRLIFIHPIICAVFIVFFWLCLLYRPYKIKILNYVIGVLLILSILGTQSRSSWISFMCVTMIVFGKRVWKQHFTLNDICGWILLSAIFTFFIFISWEKVFSAVSVWWGRWIDGLNVTNAANFNRLTMIKMGINDWKEAGIIAKLFGRGATYALDYLKQHSIRGWNIAVDNQYLTILMNFGLVGEAIFTFLGIKISVITLKTKNTHIEFWGLVCISMFISSFFYEMLSWTMVTMLFSFALCMLNKEMANRNYYKIGNTMQ